MAETLNQNSERTIMINGQTFLYRDLKTASDFLMTTSSTTIDRALEIMRAAAAACGTEFDEPRMRQTLSIADRIWQALTDEPTSGAAQIWNEENEVGTPVQYWPQGRSEQSFLTRTVSPMFDSSFGPLVLLADVELLVSVQDIDPAPWAASILQAEGCC